jgi:hypothetical protein
MQPISPPTEPLDWKTLQMIKASGWPLGPECLAAGTDFNAPCEGGLRPLEWASQAGKPGLLAYMLDQGANAQAHPAGGLALVALAMQAGNF